VLALVRNNRRGLYNSPAILSASFVFDELHAYEDRMFAAIIALIKALPGASFLLMTASLPKARKDFLLNELGRIQTVPQPRDLEELPRYTFEELANSDEADEIVKQATSQNLRVLWVCNTVSRAQRRFEGLRDAGLRVKTYHSRFKYEDRRDRHREVISAFGDDAGSDGFVAVTTQVAEMSLDLDADILISEVAPVPSLIQRLGRLNRRITPEEPGSPRPAYFVPPEKPAPYAMSELAMTGQWLDLLNRLQRPLTQADLANAFNSILPNKELQLELRTEWLDSGYFAIPGPVREAGISVSVILPEDETVCRRERKEIIWKAIPMNFDSRRGMENWRELKGNLIAPPDTILYSKEVGARWLEQ
jgi:CRISPR-associated endonuclease/helicase Cas3